MTRIIGTILMGGVFLWIACARPAREESKTSPPPEASPIPVILDTDIGSDIDDTWALALLLNLPELDLKLVVTDSGDTRARARLAARYLEVAGRSDVPVGVGLFQGEAELPQEPWVEGYELENYPGTVFEDGVDALIRTIRRSPEPVLLFVIGPAPNIAEALRRDPGIVDNARVIAMSGSIDVGYGGKPEPETEYNVKQDPAATRAMYEAGWDVLLAPLDTAGTIQLTGESYQRVLGCEKPEVRALIENYRIWAPRIDWAEVNPDVASSTLFDTLAIALAVEDRWVEIEKLRLEVTDDGFTRRSEQGAAVRAAVRWKDRDAYHRWLVERLVE